ncbi:MAG: c-type cytochrome [Candidatus Zixiibacteriota bacterium]
MNTINTPKPRRVMMWATLGILTVAAAAEIVTAQTKGTPAAPSSAQVERGKYLVTGMGCNDCHTPWEMTPQGPQPNMKLMLSGHPETLKMPSAPAPSGPWLWQGSGTMTAFAGPWGVSYAANITPDQATGLGSWTADTFIKAMRNGKHAGTGAALLPPMPWIWYKILTDDDLAAMFAYLQSVPPIKNRGPANEVAPPPSGMK